MSEKIPPSPNIVIEPDQWDFSDTYTDEMLIGGEVSTGVIAPIDSALSPHQVESISEYGPEKLSKMEKIWKKLGKLSIGKSNSPDVEITNPFLDEYHTYKKVAGEPQNWYTPPASMPSKKFLHTSNYPGTFENTNKPPVIPLANGSGVDAPNERMDAQPEKANRQGEFVKRAPLFVEQAKDTTRTNPIEYVNNMQWALGTNTEGRTSTVVSEHGSMVALTSFLEKVIKRTKNSKNNSANVAQSMLENMTFIGKKEYDEATKGIAEKWSEYLQDHPNAQICAIIGKIQPGKVKSDAYLLDNILKNFSDEQLDEFSGRLVLDPSELTGDHKDARIVMLDDWTISGQQLTGACWALANDYPEYKDRMEVQLVAAAENRINGGINFGIEGGDWAYQEVNVPVNAYYVANKAPREFAPYSRAHITGHHCAVDFDFNDVIAKMAAETNTDMPPATNIVRPYRKTGAHLTEVSRLRGLSTVDSSPQTTPSKVNSDRQAAFSQLEYHL